MRSTFKATVKMLLRTPGAIVWALAFPILMSTLFMFMFSSMRTDGTVDAVPVAVVADGAWEESTFSQVIDGLASGDDPLMAVREVDDAAEARALLEEGEVDGTFEVDEAGVPHLTVAPESSDAHQGERGRSYGINRSILETLASSYVQSAALIEEVAASDPAALADPAAVALMGMAALFASQLSMLAVANIRPTASAVAARRSIAGVSRVRQLAGALAGSWLLSVAFLTIAFCYVRFVVNIDFAGREVLCLVGIAGSAFMAAGLGSLVGSLPLHGGASAGSGILTGLTCVLSIFAGLYGEPAMKLADAIAHAVPVSAWINPTKLVCDLFHSLYFYESLAPFAARLAACIAWGVVFFAFAAPLFRRQRYAHL